MLVRLNGAYSLISWLRSPFYAYLCYQQIKMADPLSITASIVGIVVLALHATRLLLGDLQQLEDAPKTVKRLVDDVRSINTTLELL